ncbi:MAG: hypothetical protein JXQ90_09905 [Cyclobacteriaceae bacterium]
MNFSLTKQQQINPKWYLLIGIVLSGSSHLTFSVDLLAWISVAPFLIYLSCTSGWKSRLLFACALIVTWTLIVSKIITAPIPYLIVFLYAIPITLFHLPGYLIWAKYRKANWSVLLFPAVMAVLEWVQYTFTPLASWGVAAYSQTHSPGIMQFVSLFGLPGLSFLIYWINTAITDLLLSKKTAVHNSILPLVSLCFAICYGALRLDIGRVREGDVVTAAAVGTDSTIGGLPVPSFDQNVADIVRIFDRTKQATSAGAELIVWNEAAFYLLPENEMIWLDSISNLSETLNTSIVAAYVLLTNDSPLQYENKYRLFQQGKMVHTYLKHQPVPGEPAVKGVSELVVFDFQDTKLGGAICYDYDFPYLAKGYGELGADIVALPSSDWRGIDPLHTRMAAFRAAEQGHSIVRSTRFGLSAAIDPFGVLRSSMSSFENNDKIMMAQIPKKGIKTLYSIIGDVLVYGCIVFIALFIAHDLLKSRANPVNI